MSRYSFKPAMTPKQKGPDYSAILDDAEVPPPQIQQPSGPSRPALVKPELPPMPETATPELPPQPVQELPPMPGAPTGVSPEELSALEPPDLGLAEGDQGVDIQGLQEMLADLGYLPKANVNGKVDVRFVNGLKMLQKDAGVPVTGKLDEATRTAIFYLAGNE